jgi:hypothetical protein
LPSPRPAHPQHLLDPERFRPSAVTRPHTLAPVEHRLRAQLKWT